VAAGDEEGSVMLGRRWQPLQKMLSVAGSIALITSVLLGGDVGVIAYGCRASLFTAALAGMAAALTLAFLTIRYQRDRWRTAPPGS
jgi:dolichol kinase